MIRWLLILTACLALGCTDNRSQLWRDNVRGRMALTGDVYIISAYDVAPILLHPDKKLRQERFWRRAIHVRDRVMIPAETYIWLKENW